MSVLSYYLNPNFASAGQPALGNTTSTTYADLAVGGVGPSLSHLPDGIYLIVTSATAGCATPASGSPDHAETWASISINGSTPSDGDAIYTSIVGVNIGLTLTSSKVLIRSLRNGNNNSLVMKYRAENGTPGSAAWADRVLTVLRLGPIRYFPWPRFGRRLGP